MRFRSTHSGRLERWLGAERTAHISESMKGWYGPPIHLLDVPGSVRVGKDGDFIGPFERGIAASAMDALWDHLRQYRLRPNLSTLNVGFPSVDSVLSRMSQGYYTTPGGNILKNGGTGVAAVTNTLWRLGASPASGGAGSAAPGGRACSSSTTGAMTYANPSAGTMHLVGADMYASVLGNSLLLYDRIFDVAKTMNSTATEAVTGVPTRYQSSTVTDPDYAGGNFLFVEVGGTALAATAHNWTTCLYRNQAGTDNQTLPSLTGNSGAIVDRLDHPVGQWFAPLASGDTGVMDLAQMQCSAAVATGAINFVIGHPIGFMAFPLANLVTPFDWLTNRQLAPRVFDSACLALLEVCKPSTTATNYGGTIYLANASA